MLTHTHGTFPNIAKYHAATQQQRQGEIKIQGKVWQSVGCLALEAVFFNTFLATI